MVVGSEGVKWLLADLFCFALIGLAASFSCAICLLVLSAAQACKKTNQAAPEMVLTIIDQSWLDKPSQALLGEELNQFTQETGIRVQILPAPEVALEQLETWRNLLESGAKVPDVYGIDVIWPGILADNLVDLKAYVPEQEIATHFPELIRNNTVNGRLVALPYNLGEGLLFYRVDLLHKYGYPVPPKTWDELEKMAKRIQAGERAKGNKDFWGYVWQGAPSEALTCNALEWQVSEGGGTILDENGRITVNNPHGHYCLGEGCALGWVNFAAGSNRVQRRGMPSTFGKRERLPSCATGRMPTWPPAMKTRPPEISSTSRRCRRGGLVRPQPWEDKAMVFRAIHCIRARPRCWFVS